MSVVTPALSAPPNLFFGVRWLRLPLISGAMVISLVVAVETGVKRGIWKGLGLGWGGGWCLPVITFFAAQEASCLPVHDTGSGAGFFPGVIIFNEAGDQLVGELRGEGGWGGTG